MHFRTPAAERRVAGALAVALALVLLHVFSAPARRCDRREPVAPLDVGGVGGRIARGAAPDRSVVEDAEAAAAQTDRPRRGGGRGCIARAYVINVATAPERWEFMQKSLGRQFSGANGLPRWQRWDAATPRRDGCDLPYSLNDCCTVSHSGVLRNFSADPDVAPHEWAIVLEDDIALHPDVPAAHFPEMLRIGLQEAERRSSPFMYLGLCAPKCAEAERTVLTSFGSTVSFRTQCAGYCTHAYAVQKFIAPRIPEYFRLLNGNVATIDAAFQKIGRVLNMSLLGSSLFSRDARAGKSEHVGMFYMKAFGDSLTSGEWESKPKVVFTLKQWSGRLGNLMFEWASVVGLAEMAGASTQAYFAVKDFQDAKECPAAAFFSSFRLQRFSREASFMPGMEPICQVSMTEVGANVYDGKGVSHMLAEIRGMEKRKSDRCKLIRVSVSGYLQSWKYFKGYEDTIRAAFAAPMKSEVAAKRWLGHLKSKLQAKHPNAEWKFVGVQVRRGDKVHVSHFKQIYEPTSWAYYERAMAYLSRKLIGDSATTKVAFVVTAGGSLSPQSKDMQETRKELSRTKGNFLAFVEGTDVYTDYAVLTACEGIIISASSFGWWAAFVSPAGAQQGFVVAPKDIYRRGVDLAATYNAKDYYPPTWKLMPNDGSSDGGSDERDGAAPLVNLQQSSP